MNRKIFFVFFLAISTSAFPAIRTVDHPSIRALEVGREIGATGMCAATDRILLCLFEEPERKSVRVTRTRSNTLEKGDWEYVYEREQAYDEMMKPIVNYVRVCIQEDCEIWPKSVFVFNASP